MVGVLKDSSPRIHERYLYPKYSLHIVVVLLVFVLDHVTLGALFTFDGFLNLSSLLCKGSILHKLRTAYVW